MAMRTIGFAIFMCALLGMTMPSVAQDRWREGEFRGTVILTITGNIGLPTRSGSSDDVDKLFSFNDITFDAATQFDSAALQALPQTQIRADFPKGGAVYTFEGPTLREVLRAAGALGDTMTLRALDGFSTVIPLAEAYEMGAIIALKRDSIPFAIGDFGPTQLVFPRAENSELADMSDDWWIWSIYHINVD